MATPDEIRKRRVEEFCRLFGQAQRPLHRYIHAMVFNTSDTYDILQDTNLAMWKNFDSFQPGTNFLAWGREIARLRTLSYFRTKKRRATTLDHEVLLQLAGDASEVRDEVVAARDKALGMCMERLDDQDRKLLHARYATDDTLEATARSLNRSVNSLSLRLRRIRAKLRSCIEHRLACS
ncbi:sigma-70 family RNA polymerase sigma factor [Aeoliella sp.]|uniref:sigma-70 family RNA polymerase sigma factor n=1 Tax=Aeoliella sp. TaxID=2795800 RepID=UPI003CCC1562